MMRELEESVNKNVAFVNSSGTVLLVKENSLLYTSYLNRQDLKREPAKDKMEMRSEERTERKLRVV